VKASETKYLSSNSREICGSKRGFWALDESRCHTDNAAFLKGIPFRKAKEALDYWGGSIIIAQAYADSEIECKDSPESVDKEEDKIQSRVTYNNRE
jgi:hypothetical protein